MFKVFLSAVTSEFGKARDALAVDLGGDEALFVRVQRDFRKELGAGTMLHKLRTYIERCDAVIAIAGQRSGAGFPTSIEAASFLSDLPDKIIEASYSMGVSFRAKTEQTASCLLRYTTLRWGATHPQ
jgi:hypothetical protein